MSFSVMQRRRQKSGGRGVHSRHFDPAEIGPTDLGPRFMAGEGEGGLGAPRPNPVSVECT